MTNTPLARPANPRFSKAWFEVDLGWGVIQALSFLGLARVRQTTESASPLSDLMRRRYAWLREFRGAVNRDAHAALRANGFRRWRKVIQDAGLKAE